MLVDNSIYRNAYVANGSSTSFAISFPFLTAEHIQVFRGVDDENAVLIPASEYTISGAGSENGGTLVLNTAPASGTRIVILRNVPITQLYAYEELDNFSAKSHEDALAKLTMIDQQQQEQIDRSIKVSATDTRTPEEYAQELIDSKYEAQRWAESAKANATYAKKHAEYAKAQADRTVQIPSETKVLASGTTSPRPLTDRFADVVNVKDFGAKGDGVTDDTGAFEAAAATGKAIFVPKGEYVINSDIEGTFYSVDSVLLNGPGTVKILNVPYNIDKYTHLSKSILNPAAFICRPATFLGQIYNDQNDPNISYTYGIEDWCPDYFDRFKAYVVWTNQDVDGYITKYHWNGTYWEPQATSLQDSLKHQGNYLYRPTPDAPTRFFTFQNPNLRLVLKEWNEQNGTTTVEIGKWDVLPPEYYHFPLGGSHPSEEYPDDTVYGNLAPTLSPDQKQIIVRGVRNSDGRIHYLLYNVEELLSHPEEKAYELCKKVVPVPREHMWEHTLTTHPDKQSTAFDGYNIYIMTSGTGYSYHYIRVFNLDGEVVCERPLTMEGASEYPLFRGTEGESLRWGLNRYGYISLQFACHVADGLNRNDITRRYGYVYDFSSGVTGARPLYFYDWARPRVYAEPSNNTLTLSRNTTSYSAEVLNYVGWNVPAGSIGIAASYIEYKSNKDTVIKSGFNTTYETSVRLLANDSYKSLACDPTTESNNVLLGTASRLWKDIFSASAVINTSDEREKVNLSDPDEAVMKAWGKVNFKYFQFTDAIKKKGEDARIHFGVVAQQVAEAFASEGLDASRYALFCYDKWDDEYEDIEVVDAEAVLDEQGNEVEPAKVHMEKRLVTPAGDRYGIRYSEALALECAYQRCRADRLEARTEALEKSVEELRALITGLSTTGYTAS